MRDISELREWANNKIKLYDKMAVEAPHLYASDVSRSMLHKVVELCDKTAWHYPSKGEYPAEGEQVFVAWTSEGSYDVVEFRYDRWGVKLSSPYAWQYIVPPKENEK